MKKAGAIRIRELWGVGIGKEQEYGDYKWGGQYK
jgi:hypothetical protein